MNRRKSAVIVSIAILLLFIIPLIRKSKQSGSPSAPLATEERHLSREERLYREWLHATPDDREIPADKGGSVDMSRNFYFILDGSGSMNAATDRHCGGDQEFPDKISGARWAIRKFLEKVPDDVNIGLYVFSYTQTGEVTPLGKNNRSEFLRAVDSIMAGGETPLADAIRYGTDQLMKMYRKQLGYGEYRLVVVTDGLAREIPEAAIYAARHGIPVYAIGLCVEADHPLRRYAVSYRAADNFSDLQRSLEETLAENPVFDATEFSPEGK